MNNKQQWTDFANFFYGINALVIILAGLLLPLTIIISVIPEQKVIAQTATIAPTTFLTYENFTYGIKFEFPSDWKKVEILFGPVTDIEFISPSKNASDIFPATISITVENNLGNITTLDQYTRVSDGLLNKALGGFNTTVESQPSTIGSIGGIPANERVLDMKQPMVGLDLKVAQVFTIQNNKAYIITYTVEPAKFVDHLPTLQRMVNSFQITK
jgi:eukaryotic-like serine/threonine-protein kinase